MIDAHTKSGKHIRPVKVGTGFLIYVDENSFASIDHPDKLVADNITDIVITNLAKLLDAEYEAGQHLVTERVMDALLPY